MFESSKNHWWINNWNLFCLFEYILVSSNHLITGQYVYHLSTGFRRRVFSISHQQQWWSLATVAHPNGYPDLIGKNIWALIPDHPHKGSRFSACGRKSETRSVVQFLYPSWATELTFSSERASFPFMCLKQFLSASSAVYDCKARQKVMQTILNFTDRFWKILMKQNAEQPQISLIKESVECYLLRILRRSLQIKTIWFR